MRRLAFRSLLGLSIVMACLAPASTAAATEKPVYYVALGDSLAIGAQPTAVNADGSTEEGYADQFAGMLTAGNPDLRMVKLGCGGESTGAMLGIVQPTPTGEGCDPSLFKYPHRTQLDEAVSFLHAHRNHLALVTIDVGANDTFCLLDLDRGCFDAGMQRIRTNLASILTQLRTAAGPTVPIVGMTYYNPFAVFWFDDPAYAQAVDDLVGEFNGVLEETYADAGVPVAGLSTSASSRCRPSSPVRGRGSAHLPRSALTSTRTARATASSPPHSNRFFNSESDPHMPIFAGCGRQVRDQSHPRGQP